MANKAYHQKKKLEVRSLKQEFQRSLPKQTQICTRCKKQKVKKGNYFFCPSCLKIVSNFGPSLSNHQSKTISKKRS